MKLIIGIGNPGEKYAKNRHNVGFIVIDKLTKGLGFKNYDLRKDLDSLITIHQSLIFAKPQTFMNSSGIVVKKIIVQYKVILPNMWVIHDDLDLPLGRYKIQKGRGPKDHNGLLSIYESLGTKNFWHVRIGVDNRQKNQKISGERYVLQDFLPEEKDIVNEVMENVANELMVKNL